MVMVWVDWFLAIQIPNAAIAIAAKTRHWVSSVSEANGAECLRHTPVRLLDFGRTGWIQIPNAAPAIASHARGQDLAGTRLGSSCIR
jgi:hypothetical protein